MEYILHRSQPFHISSNFAEFYTQYPTYIRDFVRHYMRRRPIQEQQDTESELISFLLTLPIESKFRHPGANGIPGGCMDRIMTFNPQRGYGDSAKHFFGYINRILRNQFLSLEARKKSNPVTRQETLRIVDDDSLSNPGTADNSVREDRISVLSRQSPKPWDNPAHYATVSKFLEFVREHNRELIPVLESISSCTTYSEAQADLSLNDRFFNRARSRLKVLYHSFTTGKPVPRQRRIYRSREALKSRLIPESDGIGDGHKVFRINDLKRYPKDSRGRLSPYA